MCGGGKKRDVMSVLCGFLLFFASCLKEYQTFAASTGITLSLKMGGCVFCRCVLLIIAALPTFKVIFFFFFDYFAVRDDFREREKDRAGGAVLWLWC